MSNVVLWVSLSLLLFPYLAWPLLLLPLARRRGVSAPTPELPRVSIVVPAHNEAQHLVRRLQNLEALDYPAELIEIIIASDGSTDGTAELAATWDGRVRPIVLQWPERRGKAWALNQLVAVASNDLVLFTDASAHLAPDALRRLVDAMSSPEIGAAMPSYGTRGVGDSGEGHYWSFATALRELESRAGVLHAAHGAAWLARRALLRPLDQHTINDDVALALAVRRSGARLAYVSTAHVSEAPTARWTDVFYRLRRIARGNVQLFRGLELRGLDARLALGLLQRLLKLTGFVWLVGVLAAALLGHQTWVATAALAATSLGVVSIAARAVGITQQGPLGVLGYGLVGQVATALGVFDGLTGRNARVWARAAPITGVDLMQPAPVPLRVRVAKRCFDLALTVPAVIVLAPFFLVVATLVRLTSRGPGFFVQERVGIDAAGRPTTFKMIKFRTMRSDAETASGPVWATRDDPRITGLGRVLRKLRIDELPQLLNVLKGDMSLVGPRPERPHFTEILRAGIPGYDDRVCRVKPGISGWAQVHCEYDTSLDSVREKLLFDLTYAAHLYSLRSWARMEFGMLFRTLHVMVAGKGAH